MIKLLTRHFKWKEWIEILFAAGFIVLQVWLDLKMPEYMSTITQIIQENGAMRDIWINGGYMLACAVSSALLSVFIGLFAARISSGVAKELRRDVYSKVLSFSRHEMDKFSTASLITRTTNDVTQLQRFVAMGLQVLIKAPVMAIWAICIIAGKNWEWSISTAVAVVIIVCVILAIMLTALPKFKKMQTLTDNVNRITRENLTGLRVVRAYNAEKFESEKFEKANNDLTKTGLFTQRVMQFLWPVMSTVMSGLSLAIYWIGAVLINRTPSVAVEAFEIPARVTLFSNMVVFSSYAIQVVMSFIMLTMIFIMLPRAAVSSKRILEVLNKKPSITDGQGVKEQTCKGKVEFNHVSFKYPDAEEYVLRDISFTAEQGQTVAFIGSTGSGKSTLINLVPRFYDVTEGQVLVDGVDVRDYKLEDLNNKLGYVAQRAVLFSGTVTSNIAFGEDSDKVVTKEDIEGALKIAQAKTFVDKMENGLEANITQGGTNVSGGQKQRLSIARAIARKPEIIIFDDSFSALDYKTDKRLRKALDKHLSQTTRLIVAQRIGTIKNADKIIVLDEGEMVGMGTHDELMKNCDVYKEIALSQLSQEEL